MRTVRTSVEIPEDLYKAFQGVGGILSVVTREALRDYLGIKGASEDALAVLELKHDRLIEEKLRHEQRLSEIIGVISSLELQIKQIKGKVQERNMVNEQARVMGEEINPYIRLVNYNVKSITPELHNMLLKLKDLGVEHNLESLQKWARRLEDADYLRGGYREPM